MKRVKDCKCQWKGEWDASCTLHGERALEKAARRGNGERENVFDRYEEGGDLDCGEHASDNREKYNVVERQRHAATGKATYGVRKNSAGWWVDKSEEVFHKNEMKVKFNKNLVQEQMSNEGDKGGMRNGRPPTLAEKKMEYSLQLAQERLRQSTDIVNDLEASLAGATKDILTINDRNRSKPRAPREVANDANRRRRVSNVAKELVSDRVPERDEKRMFDDVNGSLLKGETEYPSHLRMSYENDVDYATFMNRIGRQEEREKRFDARVDLKNVGRR